MINEKTYFKLIKLLPLVKCPEDFVSQVLKACDMPIKLKKKRYSAPFLREMAYGMGCAIIIIIISIMGSWSNDNQFRYPPRIAVNSQLLVNQLTNGASIIFTEKIR